LNVLRLLQIRDLAQQVERAAKKSFSVQAIVPLMRRRAVRAHETLFAINEPADDVLRRRRRSLLAGTPA
jgi:hypothetical protein